MTNYLKGKKTKSGKKQFTITQREAPYFSKRDQAALERVVNIAVRLAARGNIAWIRGLLSRSEKPFYVARIEQQKAVSGVSDVALQFSH